MNIRRIVVGTLVRRLVVILLAALLGWLGLTDAKATAYADQGIAWAACNNRAATVGAQNNTQYACFQHQSNGYRTCQASYTPESACNNPGGYTATWPTNAGCAARPPTSGGYYQAGTSAMWCNSGCAYTGGAGTQALTVHGKTYYKMPSMTATGAVCDYAQNEGSQVTQEECSTQGNLTQCVRPDGKHCAVASSGKRFCWNPDESGVKQEGNEGATKSPTSTAINAPKNPPPNGGDWQSGGNGTVGTSSGGTTNNYNITNWNSSYGNQGNGGGSTNPDGSENGNGDGDGDDDGNGPGPSTGEGLGDLYTPTEDTAASLMQSFFNAAGDTALLSQINTFFGNCGYSGTCPQWSYETDFTGNMTFAQLCDGTIADILNFAGFCVLAVAAFGAFRIAIY